MRALHVVPSVAARYGGPSEAAVSTVRALRQAGVDALLATTDAEGVGRLARSRGEEIDYLGAPSIFFPRLPGESLKPSPALARWLGRNASRFDVVHVHSVFSHPSLAAGRAARRAGVPYVVRPLGQLDAWSLSRHAGRKKVFLAAGGKRLLVRAAAIHWTDASERGRAPEFASALPSFVVPLGVEERIFDSPAAGNRERVVLFLSRLDPKKNVESLIDAFSGLGEVAAGWRLVIAGGGERAYVDSLRTRAAHAADRVEFVGWLSGEAKLRALRTAQIFVLPSKQENFGIAVAEAMASGVPVVVSEAVALSGVVRRVGAGWVAPDQAEGLAGVLAEAIASPVERARRGGSGRNFAEQRYRWATVARQLLVEYEGLVARRGSA